MKKFYLLILSFLFILNLNAQCLDVYGHKVECPTVDDSLVIYNNSLSVYSYYENNKAYKRLSSVRLNTTLDVTKCFYKLDSALDEFKMLWQKRERLLNGEHLTDVLLPRGGENIAVEEYYQKIDDYKFYQREFENGILNTKSPFPMYDIRIAPLVINTYVNYTAGDDYNGDDVEIALYIPVTVKPFYLLTAEELKVRQKVLNITPKYTVSNIFPKRKMITRYDSIVKPTYVIKSNKKDSILPPPDLMFPIYPPDKGLPIYAYNGYTGCLVGWLVGKKFMKIKKTDYGNYGVPLFGRELLENDKELDKMLKIKFGAYYEGLY